MIENDLDDMAFAGGGHDDAAGRAFEVVYLDADPTARQQVRAALAAHSADTTLTTFSARSVDWSSPCFLTTVAASSRTVSSLSGTVLSV